MWACLQPKKIQFRAKKIFDLVPKNINLVQKTSI